MRQLKALLAAEHGSDAQVIAKIEKPEALDQLEEIVAAADGVMVARGDLGVEIDIAQVPVVQKRDHRRLQPAAQAGDHRHADARQHAALAAFPRGPK